MKKFTITLICAILFTNLFAESIITGKVTDDSGEGLIGANVVAYLVDDKSVYTGTTTDFEGTYELKLEPGKFNIQYSYTGYSDNWKKKVVVKPGERKVINITMAGALGLSEVTVCATSAGRKKSRRASRVSVRGSRSAPAGISARSYSSAPASYAAPSASREMPVKEMAYADDMAFDGIIEMEEEVLVEETSLGGHTFGIPLAGHYSLDALIAASEPKEKKKEKPSAGQMTAGEQNTLSRWDKWMTSLKSDYENIVKNWGFSTKKRYSVLVLDDNDNPVADCSVLLKSDLGKTIWKARTDNKGAAELWENAFDGKSGKAGKIIVEHNGNKHSLKKLKSYNRAVNMLRLPYNVYDNPCNADILFVVDATGSMSDEINYLKAEMEDVIDRAQENNESLFLRTGSVFYRDQGDAYVTKNSPFSHDVSVTDNFIAGQAADGGGNYPEAVHSALEDAVNNFEWSEDAIARILFLILDAPPHQYPEVIKSLQTSIEKASELGIRIVPITASGIRQETEYLMKTFSAMTNGTYVFITDHSGIGNAHMAPTDDDFDVEFLNDVMVRLIGDYCKNSSCQDEQQQNDSIENRTTIIKEETETGDGFSKISFFPNPAVSWVTVRIAEDIDELQVLSMNGQLILQKTALAKGETELNVSDLATGMYIIRFRKGEDFVSSKLVIGRK